MDYIHSALEPDALDAVLLPEKGIGVIDGSEMFNVAQAVVERVDLTKSLDMEKLADHTQDVLTYFNQFIGKRQEAYDTFAASLRDHDDIEKVYISNMDFEEADTLTGELIDTFFGGGNKGTEGKLHVDSSVLQLRSVQSIIFRTSPKGYMTGSSSRAGPDPVSRRC